jgi:hypothetical protein
VEQALDSDSYFRTTLDILFSGIGTVSVPETAGG